MMIKFWLKRSIVLALGTCLLSFAACDGSKDELAATRTERDQLKAQLATLQGAMDGVKKDFEAAKAQAAKCPPGTTAGAAPTTPAAGAAAAEAGKAAPAGSAVKKPPAKK